MAELPAAQRVAVVLRHVTGLPIAEVAAVLGCPEGTAATRPRNSRPASGSGSADPWSRPSGRPRASLPRCAPDEPAA
ncbi:RNA polymerase sigma factor [Gandjariella thermophila]|uniref:RNA polymerase sigma factor n=1 Tax=Gandjariella thermophila TaxID=1931992 RepID=UPI0021F34CB5|nr:sigma-70 region 4 domain-containing protein [Gandjariella thermophila]